MSIYVPVTIPSDYHYVSIHDTYIDFYNVEIISQNNNVNFYRQYFNISPDLVEYYETISTEDLTLFDTEITNNFLARPDVDRVLLSSFIIISVILVLFNLVTSLIKKGGVLGGLL